MSGLVMSTRCGDIAPEIQLELMRSGFGPDEIEDILANRSGLLGLARVSSNLVEVIAAAEQGDKSCKLAFAVYAHRLSHYLGAYFWLLKGADAIVFTDDAGTRAWQLRRAVVRRRRGPRREPRRASERAGSGRRGRDKHERLVDGRARRADRRGRDHRQRGSRGNGGRIMLTVIARYKTKPDRAGTVAEALGKHVAATRTEPGCVQFVALRAREEPDSFLLFEVYDDEDAFAAHRASPHFLKYVEGTIVPLLDERQFALYDEVAPVAGKE